MNQQLFPLPDLHGKQYIYNISHFSLQEASSKEGERKMEAEDSHTQENTEHRTDTQNQKKQGKKYNAKLQRLCEEIQKGQTREGSGLTDQGGARNLRDKQSEKQASPGWAPLLWAMH